MSVATIGPAGILCHAGVQYRAALGANGIRVEKQEGDLATPAGYLPLRRVLFRADRGPRPRASVPVRLLAPDDGWCDAPLDAAYNTLVRRPYPAGHEVLWREDSVYDVLAVLGWNDAPPVRGRGSAIFLHLARPDYTPTEGCIALSHHDLIEVLGAGLTAIEVQP